MNYCDNFDSAENYLKFFYPNQNTNTSNENNENSKNLNGKFIKFSQTEIQQKHNIKNALMAEEGFAFIPKQCENKQANCEVHFVLHGCKQSFDVINDKYIYQTGVWRFAEKYNLIVVYPQTVTSEKNKDSCWDFWGYSSENYATNKAPQLQTLKAIAEELQSK